MKARNRIPLFISAAFLTLGLGACASQEGEDTEANVSVVVQGASTSENVFDVVLWAQIDGTQYEFVLNGTAQMTEADFVLDITLDGELVHSIPFSLPLADCDAKPGELGSGSRLAFVYPGDNYLTIDFEWGAGYQASGQTHVDIHFVHPPRIAYWSTVPGPGASTTVGTPIDVRATVEFFGTDPAVDPFVNVQFYDGTGGGAPLETPVYLSFVDPVWIGTIPAALGAEQLRLTATDEDGTTVSTSSFLVGP